MKKNWILFLLSLIFIVLNSCTSGTKISRNHLSCRGVRPKPVVYVMNYYKTDIYKRHIKLLELQERTARKSSSAYAGIYRY